MKKLFVLVLMISAVFVFVNSVHAAIIFSDNFSVLSGWTTGSGGAGSGSVTVGQLQVSPDPVILSPTSGNYAIILAPQRTATFMRQAISTADYNNISFTYYRRTAYTHPDTRLNAYWKLTSSSTWSSALESVNTDTWGFSNFSLSGAEDSSIDIMFEVRHSSNQSNDDYGLIEDVVINGDAIPTIPEPATIGLLGFGLLGLLRFRKKS